MAILNFAHLYCRTYHFIKCNCDRLYYVIFIAFPMWDLNCLCFIVSALKDFDCLCYRTLVDSATFILARLLLNRSNFRVYTYSNSIMAMRYHRLSDLSSNINSRFQANSIAMYLEISETYNRKNWLNADSISVRVLISYISFSYSRAITNMSSI